jgi:hypothetical protein
MVRTLLIKITSKEIIEILLNKSKLNLLINLKIGVISQKQINIKINSLKN